AGVCASERSRSCLGVKAGMMTCLDCFHPIVCYGIPYGPERCTTQVGSLWVVDACEPWTWQRILDVCPLYCLEEAAMQAAYDGDLEKAGELCQSFMLADMSRVDSCRARVDRVPEGYSVPLTS
ncbi:MAG: hypothetical protein ABIH41_00615, partial [Nanoarchaeota archaeon]